MAHTKENHNMGVKADFRFRSSIVAVLAFALASPVWSDTLILRDGSRLSGTLTGADVNSITFTDRRGQTHNYAVRDVDTVQFGDLAPNSGRNQDDYNRRDRGPENANAQDRGPDPNYNRPDSYSRDRDDNQARMERTVLPAGTVLAIRTNERIDARNAAEGQTFVAQVEQDIRDSDGMVAIPRGSDARLITRRVGDDGDITLDIDSVVVQGRRYRVSTTDQELEGRREGLGKNERTGKFVGGGAILGAIIGAVAGGGKGAAIGAAAGAGAGAGAEVITSGKEVRVPAETVLRFRLDHPLHMHLWS
jgi:hypothetical protein